MQKSYWNLTDRERFALTPEAITAYEEREYMDKAVPALLKLDLMEVPVLIAERQTYYLVKLDDYTSLCAFPTLKEAEDFVRTPNAFIAAYENALGYEHRYAKPASFAIEPTPLYSEEVYRQRASNIEAVAAAEAHNKQARELYAKALKNREGAAKGIRDDRNRVLFLGTTYRQIIDTFDAYKMTANGDPFIAYNFLCKAFPQSEVKAAFEWHDLPLPTEMKA